MYILFSFFFSIFRLQFDISNQCLSHHHFAISRNQTIHTHVHVYTYIFRVCSVQTLTLCSKMEIICLFVSATTKSFRESAGRSCRRSLLRCVARLLANVASKLWIEWPLRKSHSIRALNSRTTSANTSMWTRWAKFTFSCCCCCGFAFVTFGSTRMHKCTLDKVSIGDNNKYVYIYIY